MRGSREKWSDNTTVATAFSPTSSLTLVVVIVVGVVSVVVA